MLDVAEMIKAITGITDDSEILLLQARAEERVRVYLRYNEEDSVRRFASSIVEVACAIHDMEQMESKKMDVLGLKSESYAEGSVSVRKDYGGLSEVTNGFETRINNILDHLKPYRRGHVYVPKEAK